MKYLITKKRILLVGVDPDGRLALTQDGVNPIPNAGLLITQLGGVEKLLARCVDSDLNLEEFRHETAKRRAERLAEKREDDRAEREEQLRRLKRAFYEMLGRTGNPSTEHNIAVILAYLNTMNWGVWPPLPSLDVSYSVNQYDVGRGRTATAMKLYDGRKFCLGGGPRDLMKYDRLRCPDLSDEA